MRTALALLLLAGCTQGIRQQEHAWVVPYAHYSISKLPNGALTAARWHLMGRGDPDFWFREDSPYSTFLMVHGIELKDAAREKPLVDLVKGSYLDLTYVAMHFSKAYFGNDLTFSLIEAPHPFEVPSGEAVEFSEKLEKDHYRLEFVLIRSPDRQRVVVVFYCNDDRWYGEAVDDARSLARRVEFDSPRQ